ncbi:MAG: hypothetical protein JO265_14115, partial [Acidimicrobiia bacterium]|nr:hypothetical protein [Acidimicrobiia bacterium]
SSLSAGAAGAAGPTNGSSPTGRAPATTTPGSGTAAPTLAAAAPAPLAPAPVGSYAYDTSGSATYGFGTTTFPSVTTLDVSAPNGSQQESVHRLLDGAGNGFIVDQTLDFQPDGIHLDKLVLTMNVHGTTTVRTLRASPAGMVLPTGAQSGSHTFDLVGASINGQESVTVTGPGSAPVGGAAVPVVGVKTVLTLSGAATGSVEWDDALAPGFRIPARETSVATISTTAMTVDLHYTCALQRVPG